MGKHVYPDAKGRVTLGKLAEGVASYVVHQEDDGSIVLEPMVAVPMKEVWLFQNKKAKKSVAKGLKQSEAGATKSLGSFAKYATKKK